MGNFNKSGSSPFDSLTIITHPKSHISIKNQNLCIENCENKPCTYYCPTRVYSWNGNKIEVDYTRCVECGACPFGCPLKNIDWHFPKGGYGVVYKY